MMLSAKLTRIVPGVLFLGFFLTPFTSLRVGFIGPGEILIVISGALAILASHGRIMMDGRTRILKFFWVIFLPVSILGLLYNSLILGFASGRSFTPAFDFAAYCFVLFSIILVGHLIKTQQIEATSFFSKLFMFWAVTYGGLYGLSFITPSIFGLPLRYYNFFTPLVDNVHQAASITCAMGFIIFFVATKSKAFSARLFWLLSAILFAKMALDSGSTKAFLGLLFGIAATIFFSVAYRPSGRNRFVFNILMFTAVSAGFIVFLIIKGDFVADVAIRFFSESDGGGAREAIYSAGFEHGMRSLLIGYGPGSHAPYGGGFWDAHNTTLTVFLQSGLIGVLVFFVFMVRFMKEMAVNPLLIGAATAIGMYFLGGDLLRRLPTWIMMTGMVYFAGASRKTAGHLEKLP